MPLLWTSQLRAFVNLRSESEEDGRTEIRVTTVRCKERPENVGFSDARHNSNTPGAQFRRTPGFAYSCALPLREPSQKSR